jgi:two-component system OmpR family sensor kinase
VAERLKARWDGLPLTRRLVIGLLSVMAVTLVVVSSATFLALRAWTTEQIDANLSQPKAHLYADGGERGRLDEAVRSWTAAGATMIVVSPDGTATNLQTYPGSASQTAYSTHDAAALATVPTTPDTEPVTVATDALGPVRAVAVPASIDGRTVSLVAAIPLSRASEVAGRLLLVEVVAVVLALLFVALVGGWFVRRSLRPLAQVAETASEVARLPLERGDVAIPSRVPDPISTTEVGQVGLAVNAMLDHVESSLRTRADTEDRLRRFVSDAGHELRTPLAAVRGYAELMRRGAGADPAESKRAAERIEAAASRMGLLVEDLLLLASLDEERPLAHDAVDLRALVDEALAEASTSGPDHVWSAVRGAGEVTVVGDGLRLHQAVSNLLANARAHTPPGTHVSASVSTDGVTAWVAVSDDGPGFPVDLLPRATERFARGDASRSRATGGSGLGLAIVKAVAEAHGGTLEVANGSPTGAVVRLCLPVEEAASAESSSPSATGSRPGPAIGPPPARSSSPDHVPESTDDPVDPTPPGSDQSGLTVTRPS